MGQTGPKRDPRAIFPLMPVRADLWQIPCLIGLDLGHVYRHAIHRQKINVPECNPSPKRFGRLSISVCFIGPFWHERTIVISC